MTLDRIQEHPDGSQWLTVQHRVDFHPGGTTNDVQERPRTRTAEDEPTLVNPERVSVSDYDVPEPSDGEDLYKQMLDALELVGCAARREWPGWYFEQYGVQGELHELWVDQVAITIFDANRDEETPTVADDDICAGACLLVDHAMDNPTDSTKVIMKQVAFRVKDKYRDNRFKDFLATVPQTMKRAGEQTDKAIDAVFAVMKNRFQRGRPSTFWGMANITAYAVRAEGSYAGDPRHSRYGAGHGAIEGATFAVMYERGDFTDEELNDLIHALLQKGMFRELARVHIFEDTLRAFVLAVAVCLDMDSYADAEALLMSLAPEINWRAYQPV